MSAHSEKTHGVGRVVPRPRNHFHGVHRSISHSDPLSHIPGRMLRSVDTEHTLPQAFGGDTYDQWQLILDLQERPARCGDWPLVPRCSILSPHRSGPGGLEMGVLPLPVVYKASSVLAIISSSRKCPFDTVAVSTTSFTLDVY